jgi:hypothetical protein
MEHIFKLKGAIDRVVIIDYWTTHVISPEMENNYNNACARKMDAEVAVSNALEELSCADEQGLTALKTAAHKNAVAALETAAKLVEDLDNTPVPLAVKTETILISFADMPGRFPGERSADVWTRLSHAQLVDISEQVTTLIYTVAKTTCPFRDTQDY